MKKIRFLLGLLFVFASQPILAQMDASIKLNEVMTVNETSLIDEYGAHNAWVEIANISHSTYNIRGMYLTTDRSVLDKTMSVPERVKRMSQIPNGDVRTNLSGQQLVVFQLNSQPVRGSLHLAVKVDATKPTWIALYNGNATQLIDSITIPVLQADQSYARIGNNGTVHDWEVKSADRVEDRKIQARRPIRLRYGTDGNGHCILLSGIALDYLHPIRYADAPHGDSEEGSEHPAYQAHHQNRREDD